MLLATNKMEELRAYATSTKYAAICSGSDDIQGINTVFLRNWQSSENTNSQYKTVSISVTWRKRDGTKSSARITSKIALRDINLSGELMSLSTE